MKNKLKSNEIYNKYISLKKENPNFRTKDIANTLGISEAELVASRVGNGVIKLKPEPQEILLSIEQLGSVMALTRNEHCVHERHGVYTNGSFSSHGSMKMGLFVNPDIDLRLFMKHWVYCFSLTEKSEKRILRSFQFFDASGSAVHKIYALNESQIDTFNQITESFMDSKAEWEIDVKDEENIFTYSKDEDVDWKSFRQSWENLKDTHDFFPLLRKFNLNRQQAFRNIGCDFAYQVENVSSKKMLELAAEKNCEIMVFVANQGCIQIHTGPVNKLAEIGKWYNVLDPAFNMHLNTEGIAWTWVTKKPTIDGIVTALEVFDENANLIVTFFGKRKPGIPELDLWREIIGLLSEVKDEKK